MLDWARSVTGARDASRRGRLQTLWSGYGEIVQVQLEGAAAETVVVKHVAPPASPRGWASRRSHERKLRSYQVEAAFYREHAAACSIEARVPACFGAEEQGGGWLFALEDLDAAGYPERRHRVSDADIDHCLRWLARFHATFLGQAPRGLWEVGTYWHLATRQDELEAMGAGALREAAVELDRRLNACRHSTFVHGDAKVANFCFGPAARSDGGGAVAALDFQYVGGGCGVKDVAYFLSCVEADRCERHGERYLDLYFNHLSVALSGRDIDAAAVEHEWRLLFPLAWADFERFLAGWAPGHHERTSYAARMTERALDSLRG